MYPLNDTLFTNFNRLFLYNREQQQLLKLPLFAV